MILLHKKVIFIAALIFIAAFILFPIFRNTDIEAPAEPEIVETPSPTPVPTEEPQIKIIEALRAEQSTETDYLTLVNKFNPMPENYEAPIFPFDDEIEIDYRILDPLVEMLTDCTEAGNDPLVCSGYRSYADQLNLFLNKYYRVVLDGTPEEDAEDEAELSVARPGTSEHQLGLAVDIVSYSYFELDEGQEETSTQKWLMENSWKYGFILRYPNGTSDITGIIYEPWHYRYVGKIAARAIYERGITLEQYLQLIYP